MGRPPPNSPSRFADIWKRSDMKTDLARSMFSSASLSGKRAWVTGASRGLGRAIAEGLISAGANVAVTARTADALDHFAVQTKVDPEIIILPASVANSEQVNAAADQLREHWGGLDILVNCAGVSPSFKTADQVEDDEWRSVLDVNLTGMFFCSRAAGPLMFESGGGAIVNISSIHGSVGMSRLAAYSASKGGVDALTRTLALEWAERGVRVNSVAPGYFKTGMTDGLRHHEVWNERLLSRIPLGRFGEPAEVVPAVLFLASELSGYITGSSLVVDGGWTAG